MGEEPASHQSLGTVGVESEGAQFHSTLQGNLHHMQAGLDQAT